MKSEHTFIQIYASWSLLISSENEIDIELIKKAIDKHFTDYPFEERLIEVNDKDGNEICTEWLEFKDISHGTTSLLSIGYDVEFPPKNGITTKEVHTKDTDNYSIEQLKEIARKYEELEKKIEACYINPDGSEISQKESEERGIDLVTIGEIAASHFRWF